LLPRNSNDTEHGRVARLLRHPGTRVFAAYTAFFALFFWGIHGGVGHYWDWSFPYFNDQLGNLFSNKSSSWIAADMGSPLDYSSDYFLRFTVALFGFLPPELLRYGLFTGIFAAGALGMYLLCRRHTSVWLAFLVGLMTFVNPAIFYKYTAGHFNYLVAFALFIYFVYFLFYHFDKNLRSAVITGLFFALLGVQIQFFVIAALFLMVFFAFNRSKLSWRYLLAIAAIPFLIHLVWLSNFITGATSAIETSTTAAKMSFKGASASDFLSVFTFSFSKATLLSKFYAFYELLWNASLFIFLLWLLVREKRKETPHVVLLVFLAIMIFMATGLYQTLNLGPLTGLYPMLREVGHFAPIIILAALLLIARLIQKSTWRWALMCVLIGSLVIVGVKFQYYSQAYSFADVRQKFEPFREFADKDTSKYRILAYPFFGKYSFNHLPKDPESIFPLKNNGHDGFATFSSQEYVKNTVAPHEFKESVQYQLLQDYNVDILRPYNVKYIFDFSDIYESNYDRYVPATVYNNDVSLVKNDPAFFDKLLEHNPGKLRRVNEHILEIKEELPRVAATDALFSLPNKELAAGAATFAREALDRPLDYTTDRALDDYATQLTPLFNDARSTRIDQTSGAVSQEVRLKTDSPASAYVNTTYATLLYELSGGQLTIWADSPGRLLLNNQALATGTEGRRIVMQLPIDPGRQHYLAFKGTFTPLTPGSLERLGMGKAGDTVEVYATEGENLVRNSSFEQGLWQDKVGDCNNYDKDGKLDMLRTTETASSGDAALELRATRHNACTQTSIDVTGDTQYLLRFDYQSPNAQAANFFLSYGNDDRSFAKGFRAIADDQWHTATKLITTPEQGGKARLFLYALEHDRAQTIVNRYDAISFERLTKIHENKLPAQPKPYTKIPISGEGKQRFTYEDSDYQYQNIVANPSFERGAWQAKVGDCNNYDAQPELDQRLEKGVAAEGKQSLTLRATRHDACTRTTVNVTEDTDYLLTFDYRTNGTKHYGYAVSFDDPQTTVTREQLDAASGDGWHRATVKVHTPVRSTSLTLYLYAFEGKEGTASVSYDNVSMVELPDFSDRFYVAQQPEQKMTAPAGISFAGDGPSQKNIQVRSATDPFFLTLSETYSSKWRLELDNHAVSGFVSRWLPSATGDAAGTHVTASGAVSGWLIDPDDLCRKESSVRAGCTQNTDGSYDIRLVAEFTPQRWFALGAFVSWTTLLGCIAYLVFKREEDVPTYQETRRGKRR
jgi:hypothetical protein